MFLLLFSFLQGRSALGRRTYELCFVGQRRLGDGFKVFHRDSLHVVQGRSGVEHNIFHENTERSQHVGHKEVHVDVVPGAVQSSGEEKTTRAESRS